MQRSTEMTIITRRGRGPKAAFTASILVIAAVGLAGCQTGDVDRTAEEQPQQISHSNAASQDRYDGVAHYWSPRDRAFAQAPVVADRLEQAMAQRPAVVLVPVVADRLEQALEQRPAVAPTPVVADRLEQASTREVMPAPVVADRLEPRG
jgi:hypothetical protein